MPTYRYQGPNDPKPHEVVAETYEHHDPSQNVFTFFRPTSFDGVPYVESIWGLSVIAANGVEVVKD